MDLTICLFQWLKTFDLKGKCEKPQDLCDGVAITHALVQIAPEYFSTEILSKIENECGNNWFLRVSNLRRIYLRIVDYYGEVLDRTVPDKLQPDLEAIARDYNLASLGKLLQLILGCAINCVNKEKHIEIMTTLSLQVKQALKIAIDELENFEENTNAGITSNQSLQFTSDVNFPIDRQHTIEEFNRIREELSMVHVLKENAMQRCSDLESTIAKLEDEKRNLKQENEKLSEKLSKNIWGSSSNQRPFDSIENENLFQRLNGQLNAAQLELSRMEEQKEDYKIQLEIKEKEYQKILLQLDQLQTKLNEFKHDRDELDRLKYLNEEIIKCKNINEIQKKKLEEYHEYKKQMKIIEERNASLIKQICELEEDKKSISVYKNQLDLIKKQRDELRAKVNEETFRADKIEDELKRIYKKYNDIVQEKEKMQLEMEKIRTEITQLQRNNDSGLMNGPSIDMDLSTITATNSSNHLYNTRNNLISNVNNNNNNNNDTKNLANENEKIIRLEYENEKLRKELKNSNDERIRLLESQLDDEKNRVNKLEKENRLNSQKIIELEGRLKEIPDLMIEMDNGNGGSNTNAQYKSKLKELQIENNNLKTMLEKKNEEIAEREERFKKHLNKAKETYGILETHMINAKISSTSLPLDAGAGVGTSSSTKGPDDVEYWRHQCHEKDIELEKIRQDFEQKNAFRDIEERLMSVSFHTMTFNLQRKAAEDRIYSNNFPSNTTFLSRQRQASSRKFIIPSRHWFQRSPN
ncbi:protein Hook homolog 3-like isoform X1 [Dermatophagoides pteronyssinus]|uniref:protein Hook homolog 3-like isoform X1 n=1 Tax=Dermatophagoides pteronyssinus TaxID=6956 RepID=UPI003F663532